MRGLELRMAPEILANKAIGLADFPPQTGMTGAGVRYLGHSSCLSEIAVLEPHRPNGGHGGQSAERTAARSGDRFGHPA